MTPTYPRVGLKPRGERNTAPTMLRPDWTPRMLEELESRGLKSLLWWKWNGTRETGPYLDRAGAERILAVIPREGKTCMALRRQAIALIRRWDRGA